MIFRGDRRARESNSPNQSFFRTREGNRVRSADTTTAQCYDRGISRSLPVKLLRPAQEGDCRLQELDAKLIGESEPMRNLKKSIRTVATSSETVLITGESGTGKELIARAIHDLGRRRDKPFVPVNCGAL